MKYKPENAVVTAMNKKNTKVDKNIPGLILNKWLLLVVSCSFIAAGCAGMKSVRNGYGYNPPENSPMDKNSSVKQVSESPKIKESEPAISEFEQKLLKSNPEFLKEKTTDKPVEQIPEEENDSDNTPQEPTDQNMAGILPANRLPTLREQMFLLNKKQNDLAEKIDSMNNDLEAVKKDVSEIKKILKETPPDVSQRVEQNISPKKSDDKIKNNHSLVLLSDQKENEKNSKKAKPTKDQIEKQAIKETFIEPDSPKTEVKTPKPDEAAKPVPADFNDAITTFKNKEYGLAVNKFKAIISSGKNESNYNEINYYIAESYFGLKDYKNAADFYNTILKSKLTSRKPESQMRVAEINMLTGNAREARSAYETLIQNYPRSDYVPKARKMLQQL